ncbi:MAG: FAD-dependent oxidoreductase [Chitinispirillaceae bacterium]
MKKILVVGGVAGGASFSARMRRLDESADIVMFEKGEYISFANCGLPYHIGGEIRERQNLIIQTPGSFARRFNVDVRNRSEVLSVDAGSKKVRVKGPDGTYEESYDCLVLSPGASPVRPPIPGIDHEKILTLRNIPDMDRIKQAVDSGSVKDAVVVGGGFIGLEMAENLRNRGIGVTLVEAMDQVFAPADPEMAQAVAQQLELHGVKLITGTAAKSFSQLDNGRLKVDLGGGDLETDLVILSIGVKPDTAFLRDSGLEMNQRGAIVVDKQLRTSLPDVFAVGDAVEVADFVTGKKVHIPLAGPANRQGRIVADVIAGMSSEYKNTQGTSICKVFDLTAAVTGLSEKNARNCGVEYLKTYIHSSNHAGYYPGAAPISLKLLFSPGDGRVLGAQVMGTEGVDKRIDVLATAVRHGLTVYDLTELELAYAPPYGSAKDPVNIAGFTAQNMLNGLTGVSYSEDVAGALEKGHVVLDVRTAEERELGFIEGSAHIPVDELRERLGELDKSKPVLVYCQVGLRGHVAVRTLVQNGFAATNLSGGYKTYCSVFPCSETEENVRNTEVKVSAACEPACGPVESERVVIDACGLQCPGPVMRLKETVSGLPEGGIVEIRATDPGFVADIPSWCNCTGNKLLDMKSEKGTYAAIIQKGSRGKASCSVPSEINGNKTMVVFSNDFDKMMATFIIANGAASMGSKVTLFFTFWGLNLLRKSNYVKVKKGLLEKMFGFMMPRGPGKLTLSKMHMGGMGTAMIRYIMKKKNVYSLQVLMQEAMKNGVRFVACAMSMDIMGIKEDELIEGVELGGVAAYLHEADQAGYNLFI